MSVERVNPAGLAPARGFSHAVVAEGRMIFLAGQTALDRSGQLVDGDIVAQFELALSNLLDTLGAAGGTPDQLATLTVYLTDMDAYQSRATEIGQVWRRLVGVDYPAMAAVGISRLWDRDALVEVQGVAVVPTN